MSWKFMRNFMEHMKNTGANNYRRGATWWAQDTRARPGGLCLAQPTSGTNPLVYMSFWPRKNKERTFGMKRRCLEAELGQEHFCPPVERFYRGNFPPGGGNHRHHHHQQLSHIGEGNLHQHHLLSNPSLSLVFNLRTRTTDWYLWVTSSVDYLL